MDVVPLHENARYAILVNIIQALLCRGRSCVSVTQDVRHLHMQVAHGLYGHQPKVCSTDCNYEQEP
jgi:hypothetical protein